MQYNGRFQASIPWIDCWCNILCYFELICSPILIIKLPCLWEDNTPRCNVLVMPNKPHCSLTLTETSSKKKKRDQEWPHTWIQCLWKVFTPFDVFLIYCFYKLNHALYNIAFLKNHLQKNLFNVKVKTDFYKVMSIN